LKLARSGKPGVTHENQQIGVVVAIEPSRQFKNQAIEDRLKLAQINKLESDSAKSRQQVMESIQNMYGVNQTQENP
jgi:hypothetical protein